MVASSLHRAGVGDAFHQEFLAVEEHQKTRDHVDHGDGKGNTDLTGIDGGQVHRQGLLCRVLQVG